MHNGVFTDLKEVVDFYNTRDTDDKWATPEVAENVNTDELGDLELADEEVDAIVAFMQTLTDGYQLQEQATISVNNGVIELPYVRAESMTQADKFYAAQLSLTVEGDFQVTQLDEISITDYSMLESMPYYSFASELLELPVLLNIDNTRQADSYIGQLKYLPTDDGTIRFNPLYTKKLQ